GHQHERVAIEFTDGSWERIQQDLRRLADQGVDLGELVNLGVLGEHLLTEFERDRELSQEIMVSTAERIDPSTMARMEGYHILGAKLPDTVYGSNQLRAYGKTIHASHDHFNAMCGREMSVATGDCGSFEDLTIEKLHAWTHAIPYSGKLRRSRPEMVTICVKCTKVVAALPEGWGGVVRAEEEAKQAERLRAAERFNENMRSPHDAPGRLT
ncbi:hypothetical protein LCGC14_0955290, partial [marine sediment metagenome]